MNKKTFDVKYVSGTTEISVLKYTNQFSGAVIYLTKDVRTGAGVGRGSGFWADIVKRFKGVRMNFATEEQFLQHLGVNKEELVRA